MTGKNGTNECRQTPGRPANLPITQWVEHFSVMAALLASCFLGKVPELLDYKVRIVRAARNYEGKQWVASITFTGHAHTISC